MDAFEADARFWNKVARKYAQDPIADLVGYNRTVARTAALLKPSDRVVEIGCGTGTTALTLAPGVAQLVGTDLSAQMVAIAQEKARAAQCANVQFSVAPATASPGGADAYLAFNVLHLVADLPAVLAHLFAGLLPGGLFISKTPCLGEMNPLIRLALPLARLIGKAPTVAVFTGSALEAQIVQAGFSIIHRERHGSKAKDSRIFLAARKPDNG